jgi:hypothetical protein
MGLPEWLGKAKEDVIRAALATRLTLERRLGKLLRETVHPGGNRQSIVTARGLELPLEGARQGLAERKAEEARIGEELAKLRHVEAVEVEGKELQRMIQAANSNYDKLVVAAEAFERDLVGAKTPAKQ